MWFVKLYYAVEFDDYAEIVDDDPDYAHPMAGRLWFPRKKGLLLVFDIQSLCIDSYILSLTEMILNQFTVKWVN